MKCPGGFDRVYIYDPGHFTPYYNAGLCSQFAFLDLDCTLITSPPTFESISAETGYRVWYLFFEFLRGSLGATLRHRPKLRRALKAIAYPAGIWRTYRRLKDRDAAVFHIHFAVIPWLDALLARALRRRGWHIVYTFQEPHPKSAWQRRRLAPLFRTCHAIVMHDDGLAAGLRELFPEFAGRISFVTHGMDLPNPSPRDRELARAGLDLLPDQPLLLFFGMIKPYKGLEDVLDAMPAVLQRIPNARLCIAGEPMMDLRGVRKKIAALPPGTVIPRLGFVPQAGVEGYFAAADLVLACYREIAASSVVLQAQAHRRPVIVTRAGGLPELVDHGRCGFLAEGDLAEAIVEALADRDRLKEVAHRGRERVEQRHSWKQAAEETLRLYSVKPAAVAAPR